MSIDPGSKLNRRHDIPADSAFLDGHYAEARRRSSRERRINSLRGNGREAGMILRGRSLET